MSDSNTPASAQDAPKRSLNFIQEIVENDNRTGKWDKRVYTRFPPEPNGYLHIGHAKSICLNFGLAEKYGGTCNLRFDDTNPVKEEQEYIDAIVEDVRWLGFHCDDRPLFASSYFEQMYNWAIQLIKDGKAYVCDLPLEKVRELRGTLKTPGEDSPFRARAVDENLDLFDRMRKGELPDGAKTLRAKIDMAHPNMNMRDPVMYRILHATHPKTGNDWCVYPMYDWAHGLEDSIEGITHSICTLEFEDHRPLYDWFLTALGIHHPQQIEFARLELTYTLMSKRKLLQLVQEERVSGWDDPRMPTLRGMRRRGYPPGAIRDLCDRVGVAKMNSTIDFALLEHCVRNVLNKTAPRYMGVLDPLKVVIENYPEGESEELDAVNNPEDPGAGTRKVLFARELYIEREDFMEGPPRKFFRLGPDREVRLRYAYFVTCTEVIKDKNGEIIELRCTYDPETRGGDAPDGRKVRGTLHWVAANSAIPAEIRLYSHLFSAEDPEKVAPNPRNADSVDAPRPEDVRSVTPPSQTGAGRGTPPDWRSNLNPDSLTVLSDAMVEPALKNLTAGTQLQLERKGYFCVDPDSTPEKLVLNQTVTLKDAWAKMQKKG